MATQTQLQFDSLAGCVHEQVLQACYERQRRRIRTLCQWMLPDAHDGNAENAARRLEFSIFIKAWDGSETGEAWPAANKDRLAAAFALHFRPLFHGAVPPSPEPPSASSASSLHAAVRALPPAHRLLYLLHELEGYTPATLAVWLDLEPSVCARLIHQARLHLLRQATMAA